MTKKQFPEGFFTKDRPIAKPRYINADEMAVNESEAYMEAQLQVDSLTKKINEVVHIKIQQLIADTEPEDVQPVVHAHWEYIDNVISYEGEFSAYECSHCHKTFLDDLCENNGSEMVDARKDFKYCPFCGARMDEKVEEKTDD